MVGGLIWAASASAPLVAAASSSTSSTTAAASASTSAAATTASATRRQPPRRTAAAAASATTSSSGPRSPREAAASGDDLGLHGGGGVGVGLHFGSNNGDLGLRLSSCFGVGGIGGGLRLHVAYVSVAALSGGTPRCVASLHACCGGGGLRLHVGWRRPHPSRPERRSSASMLAATAAVAVGASALTFFGCFGDLSLHVSVVSGGLCLHHGGCDGDLCLMSSPIAAASASMSLSSSAAAVTAASVSMLATDATDARWARGGHGPMAESGRRGTPSLGVAAEANGASGKSLAVVCISSKSGGSGFRVGRDSRGLSFHVGDDGSTLSAAATAGCIGDGIIFVVFVDSCGLCLCIYVGGGNGSLHLHIRGGGGGDCPCLHVRIQCSAVRRSPP